MPDVAARPEAHRLRAGRRLGLPATASGRPRNIPITICNGIGTSTLINLPAAGTEDDDHNPDRVKPRHSVRCQRGRRRPVSSRADRYKWSLRFTVINLTNKEALYNFLSTFSGTHYVTPRTETVELGFHF